MAGERRAPVRHLSMAKVEAKLKGLGKAIAVSTGTFEFPANASQRDIDWNHMDQLHRVYVHNTYQESVRLAVGEDFAISVAKLNFFGFPVFVDVTDILLGPGRFYQSYTLFGLIYVQNLIEHTNYEIEQNKVIATWNIASHWLLKPLHQILTNKFKKFHYRLNCEDWAIRARRTEIRKLGFTTQFEVPNFQNSNALTDNLVPPTFEGPEISFDVKSIAPGMRAKFAAGAISFLVERMENEQLQVWPEACPHEGASLAEGKKCSSNEIQCPWHGLRFQSIPLKEGGASRSLNGVEIRYSGGRIIFAPGIDKKSKVQSSASEPALV